MTKAVVKYVIPELDFLTNGVSLEIVHRESIIIIKNLLVFYKSKDITKIIILFSMYVF